MRKQTNFCWMGVLILLLLLWPAIAGSFMGYKATSIMFATIACAICQLGVGGLLLGLFAAGDKDRTFWCLVVLPLGYAACALLWWAASLLGLLGLCVGVAALVGVVVAGYAWQASDRLTCKSPEVGASRLWGSLLAVLFVATLLHTPERAFLKSTDWGETKVQCYWDHLMHVGHLYEFQRADVPPPVGAARMAGGVSPEAHSAMGYFAVYYLYAPLILVFHLDIPSVYFGFGMWWMRIMSILALASVGYSFRKHWRDAVLLPLLAFIVYIPNLFSCFSQNLFLADWDRVLWYIHNNPSSGFGCIVFLLSLAFLFNALRGSDAPDWRKWLLSGLLALTLFKVRIAFFLLVLPVWGVASLMWLIVRGRKEWCIWLVVAFVGVLSLAVVAPTAVGVMHGTTGGVGNSSRMIGIAYGIYPQFLLDQKGSYGDFAGILPGILRGVLSRTPGVLRPWATTVLWLIGTRMGLYLLPCLIATAVIWRRRERLSHGAWLAGVYGLVLFCVLIIWDVFVTHPGHGRFSAWQVTASPNYLMTIYALVAGGLALGWLVTQCHAERQERHLKIALLDDRAWYVPYPLPRWVLALALCVGLLHAVVLTASAVARRGGGSRLPTPVAEALLYIRDHTRPDAVVLCNDYWRRHEYINGIAGRRTVLSRYETMKEYLPAEAKERCDAIRALWDPQTSYAARGEILKRYEVTHVLDCSQSEAVLGNDMMSIVREWPGVTLYAVKEGRKK